MFVQRSEPQRQPAQAHEIVDDAVELAMIELRRRNVSIHTYVAQRLPTLQCDPILIEQVLLNLLKNAAEAIDGAHLAPSRRHIELRSGDNSTLAPSICERNVTAFSLTVRKSESDITWKPPESVSIGPFQPVKRCSPPSAAIRSAPGRSIR